ncbi:MAG: type II CAAX endopeptidase family protein [Caldilineaceae bacterium]
MKQPNATTKASAPPLAKRSDTDPWSAAQPNRSADHPVARHSILKSIVLHLLPGLLALLVFTLIARPVEAMGFPSIMPWLITVLFVIIPFELGYMYYVGRKWNGRWSLAGIIRYRQPLNEWQILLWTAITFGAVLVLFVVAGPITGYLEAIAVAWLPAWFVMDTGVADGSFQTSTLLVVNISSIFVFVIGVAIVEELYFRGFLLPRLAYLGGWAVLINSLLFALYHFTTPWQLVTRVLITLPLAYVAYRKQNLIPSMLVHALANSVDVIMGFAYILSR